MYLSSTHLSGQNAYTQFNATENNRSMLQSDSCSSGKVETKSLSIESAHRSGTDETEFLARHTYAGNNRGIDFECRKGLV